MSDFIVNKQGEAKQGAETEFAQSVTTTSLESTLGVTASVAAATAAAAAVGVGTVGVVALAPIAAIGAAGFGLYKLIERLRS